MWIASNIGFYSVVKKRPHFRHDGPEVHVVRARDKADLCRLLAKISEPPGFEWKNLSATRIHEWDYSDYRYRIYVESREDFAAIFTALGSTIDYANFKDEIKAMRHQKKIQGLRRPVVRYYGRPPRSAFRVGGLIFNRVVRTMCLI